jgi:hypothetical protein
MGINEVSLMRQLKALRLLVPLVALVALAVSPALVGAQENAPRPPANTTLNGEVKDVNPLTVTVNGQDYLLATAPNVVVNRGGKEVKLGDLNRGDQVTFTTGPDTSVLRMDVTEAATDMTTWLIVGALVLLALAALAFLMMNRNRNRPVTDTRRGPTVTTNR